MGNELFVPHVTWRCSSHVKAQKNGLTRLCNDPARCFSVALTDCMWTQPWKETLTASHPWANQKAVQNNRLLLQSCHLRGSCIQEQQRRIWRGLGGCLDMTMVSVRPWSHGKWHGGSKHEQVGSTPLKKKRLSKVAPRARKTSKRLWLFSLYSWLHMSPQQRQ